MLLFDVWRYSCGRCDIEELDSIQVGYRYKMYNDEGSKNNNNVASCSSGRKPRVLLFCAFRSAHGWLASPAQPFSSWPDSSKTWAAADMALNRRLDKTDARLNPAVLLETGRFRPWTYPLTPQSIVSPRGHRRNTFQMSRQAQRILGNGPYDTQLSTSAHLSVLEQAVL